MIVAERLSKHFGSIAAVRDVSFIAPDGLVTGLLGANGAGKSTTLRMLYTALKPDSGRALIDGHDCAADPLSVRRCLAVLPHAAGVYPNLTARENVRYYAQLQGMPGDALDAAIARVLEQLDLGAIADRRARGFSQGQRIKVALARVLVHRPRNIILDEPTTGLDVKAVRQLRELIARLRDQGCCVVISSHVMQEMAALCDQLVIIAHGRVLMQGSPAEMLAATGAGSLEDAFVQLAHPEDSDSEAAPDAGAAA